MKLSWSWLPSGFVMSMRGGTRVDLCQGNFLGIEGRTVFSIGTGIGTGGRTVENQWQDLFSSPSDWRDYRLGKRYARFPDFKHKETDEALWANNYRNPSWVETRLATMAPRIVPRDLSSCNKMLAQYVKSGQQQKTIQLFKQMQHEGMSLDKFTFMSVLNACSSLQSLEEGRKVHVQITRSACKTDLFVCSSLINMYTKCGTLEDARKVFDDMPIRDVAAWNAMIQGYAKQVNGQKALALFRQMQREGLSPTRPTFLGALNACTTNGALEEGQRIHAQIIQCGFESDLLVGNALLDMYAKCGSTMDVERLFDKMWTLFRETPVRTESAWNAIIQGSVKCGQPSRALELFQLMQGEGVKPNGHTFVGVLHACTNLRALEEGRRIHELVVGTAFSSDVFVERSLVDMYSKCGSIEDARKVFDEIPTCNVVAWTTIIQGYANRGQGWKALELFQLMQMEHVQPNRITFLGVLNACASTAALESGRRVHSQIIRSYGECDKFMGNALVDMYAKCGSVEDAWKVFKKMPTRDVVAWTAMLGGYATVGHAKDAFLLFEQMFEAGVQVDAVTFICLLSACSYVGLVDEGVHLFESMSTVYGVPPTIDHFAYMVDLLGRAGRLHEAEDYIKTLSCKSNISVLMALLGACRVHGNVEIAERIAKQVIELDLGNASGYVLLSNIYSACGNWDKREDIQRMKIDRDVKKEPGCTWIEVNNQVHSFTVDDQKHPKINEIHAQLKRLSRQMRRQGTYLIPDSPCTM